MTCIVALKENGNTIYMGCDSSAASGWEIFSSKIEKVFIVDEFIIGYTTSFRMGQLLQYKLDVPKQIGDDDLRYMSTVFIDSVRACLKEGGFSTTENERESGGQFIVGYKGGIYLIDSDYQVNIYHDDYLSIGCGANFALGSLFFSHKSKDDVILALEAANHFSNGVCPPFNIKEIVYD